MSEDIDWEITDRFDIRKRLGKGAYGIVWKATDRRTGHTIALKKIFDAFRNKTDAQRTFREIMFLQEFSSHPNIITILEIIKADNDKDIYLTFEYMDTDLHNVIKKGNILKPIHKQYIMYQLFRAVKYLHSGNVIHRDLKPSNVLLDVNCTMKLADFGLSRSLAQFTSDDVDVSALPELTEYVATRWYRAPEILLSAKRYTKGVDTWSLGCILGELWLNKALFPGTSTMNQLERIMMVLESPSKADIESIGSAYAESVIAKMGYRPGEGAFAQLLHGAPKTAIDMVERLLVFNPDKRLTVDQCISHAYVAQFHKPQEEYSLSYDVTLCLPDDVQLSVSEYRNKLYDMILSRKSQIRRVYHDTRQQGSSSRSASRSGRRKSVNARGENDENGVQAKGAALVKSQSMGNKAPLAQSEGSDIDSNPSHRTSTSAALSPRNLNKSDSSQTLQAVSASKSSSSLYKDELESQNGNSHYKRRGSVESAYTNGISVGGGLSSGSHHVNSTSAMSHSFHKPRSWSVHAAARNLFRSGSKERVLDHQQHHKSFAKRHFNNYLPRANQPSLGEPRMSFESYSQKHGTITSNGMAALKQYI